MKKLLILSLRNIKLFFSDKGLFFTSLITPLILLVLYATFLGNVYRDSFLSGVPTGVIIDERLVDSFVAGQLISSILAVSCVTVAFCSNMLMVQDKVTGALKDFSITPLKKSTLSLSYYVSTLVSTLIICLSATAVCLVWAKAMGIYISALDVLLLFLDVVLLSMFGTALSSIVNYFLSTQGQISAVGTIVSSGYGFICGAYMPISQFSPSLQKLISFLPGTYGTSLVRTHSLSGTLEEMKKAQLPNEFIEELGRLFDITPVFSGKVVNTPTMYAILSVSTIILIAIYVIMNLSPRLKRRR